MFSQFTTPNRVSLAALHLIQPIVYRITGRCFAILLFRAFAFVRLWSILGPFCSCLPAVPTFFACSSACPAFTFCFAQWITPLWPSFLPASGYRIGMHEKTNSFSPVYQLNGRLSLEFTFILALELPLPLIRLYGLGTQSGPFFF